MLLRCLPFCAFSVVVSWQVLTVRLLRLCRFVKLTSWTKSRFWSGTTRPMCPKERASSWSRWKPLSNGSRMQRKVSAAKRVVLCAKRASVKARNIASFPSCVLSICSTCCCRVWGGGGGTGAGGGGGGSRVRTCRRNYIWICIFTILQYKDLLM